MYLGRNIQTVKAEDAKNVYAVAPVSAKSKRSKKAARVIEAPILAVVAEPELKVEEPVTVLETGELENLREKNAVQLGRIHKLLALLKVKNRTIARQQREIQALSQSEPLTVEKILQGQSLKS